MNNIQDLMLARKNDYAIMNDLVTKAKAEKRELAADEQTQWDKANESFDKITKQIETLERQAKVDEMMRAKPGDDEAANDPVIPNLTDEQKRDANKKLIDQGLKRYLRYQNLSEQQRDALNKFHTRGADFQTVGTDGHGGYLVPEEWDERIIRTMVQYGGMLEAANIVRTATGGKLHVPTVPDAGGGDGATAKGVLITEISADVVSDITFAEKTLDAYTYSSRLIKASYELLQDNDYDLEGMIMDIAAERLGRIANEHWTTADGSSKPQGVVPATSEGKEAASATALTADELVDLLHSVDPAYRSGPNVRFMFNDATLALIKKLSFGSNDDRPLWVPSIREGEPDRLLGYKYIINQDMATAAADAKTVLFGDFNKFWIRIVRDFTFVRLNERYAETRAIGYFGFMRTDSELMDANAIKHLKQASA